MKYVIQKDSGAEIRISSFIKTDSDIQKFIRG
jgi:hypothetical protein